MVKSVAAPNAKLEMNWSVKGHYPQTGKNSSFHRHKFTFSANSVWLVERAEDNKVMDRIRLENFLLPFVMGGHNRLGATSPIKALNSLECFEVDWKACKWNTFISPRKLVTSSRAGALAAWAERLGCPSWGGWVNEVYTAATAAWPAAGAGSRAQAAHWYCSTGILKCIDGEFGTGRPFMSQRALQAEKQEERRALQVEKRAERKKLKMRQESEKLLQV